MPAWVAMTGSTRCAESLKYFVDMAALTLHVDMRTGQRELGFIVIKRGIIPA